MKPEKSPLDEGATSKLLHEWKIDSPKPPRFNEQVWQRIARAEAPAVTPLEIWRDWVVRTFARPAMAVSYLTFLLLIGLSIGFWQGHVNSERTAAELSTRYVQLMSSYDSQR